MPARLEKFRIADRVECKTKTLKFERGGNEMVKENSRSKAQDGTLRDGNAKNRLSKNRIWD